MERMLFLESLVYSFNISAPLFIIGALGYYLCRKKMLSEEFLAVCNTFDYVIALPAKIFLAVYLADFAQHFSVGFIFYYMSSVTAFILIVWGITSILVKDKQRRSALIHCSFRSNYSIISVSLAANMFPPEEMGVVMMLMPSVLLINNVFTVIILGTLSPTQKEDKKGKVKQVAVLLKEIIKNPLIVATAVGLFLNLLHIPLPGFAYKSMYYLGSTATPLALLAIGAQIDFKKFKGNLEIVGIGTVVKLVVMPIFVVVPAFFIDGFTNAQISALFLASAVPLSVSSYIMAENMASDAELTSQIVLSTTLFSMITVMLGITILNNMSII